MQAYQWVQGIGFGLGSTFFHIGAMLLLFRQSRGRCRPSFQQVLQSCLPALKTTCALLPAGML